MSFVARRVEADFSRETKGKISPLARGEVARRYENQSKGHRRGGRREIKVVVCQGFIGTSFLYTEKNGADTGRSRSDFLRQKR
jgi:hypothetical protein